MPSPLALVTFTRVSLMPKRHLTVCATPPYLPTSSSVASPPAPALYCYACTQLSVLPYSGVGTTHTHSTSIMASHKDSSYPRSCSTYTSTKFSRVWNPSSLASQSTAFSVGVWDTLTTWSSSPPHLTCSLACCLPAKPSLTATT